MARISGLGRAAEEGSTRGHSGAERLTLRDEPTIPAETDVWDALRMAADSGGTKESGRASDSVPLEATPDHAAAP